MPFQNFSDRYHLWQVISFHPEIKNFRMETNYISGYKAVLRLMRLKLSFSFEPTALVNKNVDRRSFGCFLFGDGYGQDTVFQNCLDVIDVYIAGKTKFPAERAV